jgi:hypothetical protein
MDDRDYMRGGPTFRRPPAHSDAVRLQSHAAPEQQKCVACKHGMVTRADDEARPTYYCLLAGVEIQHIVTGCTRFQESPE